MPDKETYEAMHADAMASMDAIEEMQRGLSQLTGNIKRLADFSGKFLANDGKEPDTEDEDEGEEKGADKETKKKLIAIKIKKMRGSDDD